MLPPVNTKNKSNKINSAPCKYPQPPQKQFSPEAGGSVGKQGKRQSRPSHRQASAAASAVASKQYKTKAIQNFTFNQPGNLIIDLHINLHFNFGLNQMALCWVAEHLGTLLGFDHLNAKCLLDCRV